MVYNYLISYVCTSNKIILHVFGREYVMSGPGGRCANVQETLYHLWKINDSCACIVQSVTVVRVITSDDAAPVIKT